MATGIDFQVIENRAYSAADQFEILAEAMTQLIAGSKPRYPVMVKGLLGPNNASLARAERDHLDWAAFRDATLDVVNFIETEHRVPSQVFVAAEPHCAQQGDQRQRAEAKEHRTCPGPVYCT